MGIGGAPEGVITAAALRCLGGEIQARFRYRNDEERERGERMGHGDEERVYRTEDLAPGENLVFAATGVTAGDLLQGVRFFGGGARTHSLVMAYQTKQVRFVDTVHMFDRESAAAGPPLAPRRRQAGLAQRLAQPLGGRPGLVVRLVERHRCEADDVGRPEVGDDAAGGEAARARLRRASRTRTGATAGRRWRPDRAG